MKCDRRSGFADLKSFTLAQVWSAASSLCVMCARLPSARLPMPGFRWQSSVCQASDGIAMVNVCVNEVSNVNKASEAVLQADEKDVVETLSESESSDPGSRYSTP